MSPQRYFLNVYLAACGRKWIHDFALESSPQPIVFWT